VALILIGLVLGPWLILVGLVPLIWAGRTWLREAMAEWRVLDEEGSAAEPDPAPREPASESASHLDRPAAGAAPARSASRARLR
jgi:hypothetical protein